MIGGRREATVSVGRISGDHTWPDQGDHRGAGSNSARLACGIHPDLWRSHTGGRLSRRRTMADSELAEEMVRCVMRIDKPRGRPFRVHCGLS